MTPSEKDAVRKEAYVAVLLRTGEESCAHPIDSAERAYWLEVYRGEFFSLEGA